MSIHANVYRKLDIWDLIKLQYHETLWLIPFHKRSKGKYIELHCEVIMALFFSLWTSHFQDCWCKVSSLTFTDLLKVEFQCIKHFAMRAEREKGAAGSRILLLSQICSVKAQKRTLNTGRAFPTLLPVSYDRTFSLLYFHFESPPPCYGIPSYAISLTTSYTATE